MALQAAKIVVDIADHTVEAGAVFVWSRIAVQIDIARFDVERAVRGIGGDITEEGLVGIFCYKPHALAKEHVGAIALIGGRNAILKIGVIKVVVAPMVAGIADTATGVVDRFVESTLVRAEGLAVAEVPFAEMAGAITGCRQCVGQGPFVCAQ